MTEPKISDIIRSLISEDDLLAREIFAGTINLYRKAMKGRLNQNWDERDVSNLLILARILMTVQEGIPEDLDERSEQANGVQEQPIQPPAQPLPKSLRELTGSPRKL